MVNKDDDTARFKIDASMQIDNGGGLILDSDGRVVGVATEKFVETKMIKARESFPQLINFGVKSSILVGMLWEDGLKNYRQARPQSNDEFCAVIKESVYPVVCYMTEKRRQEMAQGRWVFETLRYDFG